MSDDEKYNAIFPIMMTTLSIKSQEHQNVENQMSDM